MKLKLSIVAALSLAVVMVSCKKDIVERENTYPNNTSSNGALANFIAQNAPPVQQFNINANTGGFIFGANGAEIIIAPNAFVYQNNQPVSGNVTISLQEVYSKRDIIFSGGFTTSNGLPLISGGEINITAYQGSQELRLANSSSVTVSIPAVPGGPPMEEFIARSIDGNSDFTMVNGTGNVSVIPDSSGTATYSFQLDSLDWTNCDQYMCTNEPLTRFFVPMPNIFDGANSMLIITSEISMFAAQVRYFDDPSNSFTCGYYRLPIGGEFTFTVISEISGQFFYDSRTVTITEEIFVTMNPQPATEAEVLQKVNSL